MFCLQVRMYRPWSAKHFMEVLPPSVSRICVMDRTKEAGALGDPLFLDVQATVAQDEQEAGSNK